MVCCFPAAKPMWTPRSSARRALPTPPPPTRGRDTVDELLLQDAYNMRKPVLGICYGLQTLNVYRTGSLIQHIPDFLPEDLRSRVNHEAGKKIAVAHAVEIEKDSKLGEEYVARSGRTSVVRRLEKFGGNSSPRKFFPSSIRDKIGNGLRIAARCPDDGIIEALEGTAPDHFVLAVQWHPERSVDEDEPSRAIFRALIEAAEPKQENSRWK